MTLDKPESVAVTDAVPARRGPIPSVSILRSGASGTLEEEELPRSGWVGPWQVHGGRGRSNRQISPEEPEDGEESGGLHYAGVDLVADTAVAD